MSVVDSRRHLVVGAGAVGFRVAAILAEQGELVCVVTRSGSGPRHPRIECVKADAQQADQLARLAEGATAIYNCANPAYHRWALDWPPIATSLLTAAERTGAVLATVSNLYGYGPVDGPITERTPLNATYTKGRVRADMWRQALEFHHAGRARITEVRASDYLGPRAHSVLGDRVVSRVLAGKSVSVVGSSDVVHTWTYTEDVARLLVTVAVDERALGYAWHVPSHPPRTSRQVILDLCKFAGVSPVSVKKIPMWLVGVGGIFVPLLREMKEIGYQFTQPFVMDSSHTEKTFGLVPTDWEQILRSTIDFHRGGST